MKGDRLGSIHDIYSKNSISVTTIIRKERLKVCMVRPTGILQVLWESIFMDTSKGVCNY